MRRELLLAGAGGQGIILAGVILAEAAVRQGLFAAQSQAYGPQSRGGATKAEVVISDREVLYPRVERPDLILLLSREAYGHYGQDVPATARLVVDSSFVSDPAPGVLSVPITETVREKLKRIIVANMAALGLVGALAGVVERSYLEEAVRGRVPRGTAEINLEALGLGYQMAQRFMGVPGC